MIDCYHYFYDQHLNCHYENVVDSRDESLLLAVLDLKYLIRVLIMNEIDFCLKFDLRCLILML